jgi:hypothetical protein
MSDEAINFIIDVGLADLGYLDDFKKYPEITIGAIQGMDYIYTPGIIKDIISRIASHFVYPTMEKIIYEKVPATLEMIKDMDNVKCINDEIVFDLKEYLTNAEIPFALSVIRDTPLKNYTKLPDDIDEVTQKLANIPLCKKYNNLFEIPKIVYEDIRERDLEEVS